MKRGINNTNSSRSTSSTNSENSNKNAAETNRDNLYDMLGEIIAICFKESPNDPTYYDFDLIGFHHMSTKINQLNKNVYKQFANDIHDIRDFIQSKKKSDPVDSRTGFRDILKYWGYQNNTKKSSNTSAVKNVAINNIASKFDQINTMNTNNVKASNQKINHNVELNSLVDRMNRMAVKNSAVPIKKVRRMPKSWIQ